MTNHKMLVLFFTSTPAQKVQLDRIRTILQMLESPDYFCTANELLNRNEITSNRKKMMNEAKHIRLRSFRFFINKN